MYNMYSVHDVKCELLLPPPPHIYIVATVRPQYGAEGRPRGRIICPNAVATGFRSRGCKKKSVYKKKKDRRTKKNK